MRKNILRKQVLLVCFFVCFSVITYGIINMGNNQSKIAKVNALPISNKRIIIDAGHGIPDEGAQGFYGTTEQAINLSITLKLQKLIEQSGATVILTRSDENGIYSTDSESIKSKKVSDIKNRVYIGNNSEADIFISIHLNKFPESSKYRGWQAFYQKDSEDSQEIAKKIQDYLNKNIEYNNTRVALPISNVYIMKNVTIPSVIVECGFLSNEEETRLLNTDEYQNKIAWGIFIAIQDYFQQKGK